MIRKQSSFGLEVPMVPSGEERGESMIDLSKDGTLHQGSLTDDDSVDTHDPVDNGNARHGALDNDDGAVDKILAEDFAQGNAPTPNQLDRKEGSHVIENDDKFLSNSDLGHGRDRRSQLGSIRAIGSRPLGFGIVAQVRKLEKKERSRRRLMESARNLSSFRESNRALETTPLLKDDNNITDQADNEESGEDKEVQDESLYQLLFDMVAGKYVSYFLVFMPFAILSHYRQWSPMSIFWFNFLTMIPLASILGDFTEEVAAHTNQVIGGLINATFGNAVEVVVAIQALMANEIRVVQASMLGSIFSNLLLVLGCCFFFGGLRYKEQSFNSTAATANMSLLALSSIALVLPTPFAEYYDIGDEHVLAVSRVAALFLMFMYAQLLIFQLNTHAHLFEDDGDGEVARIPFGVAILCLVLITLMIAGFSYFLVDSIDGFCADSGVSRTFVGLIILPVVGNAVEHITAVSVAMKNKMDLAMGVAVGSCTQISLFVVPLTVLVGWATGKHMTLNFTHFEIILFVLSVMTVSICLSNPKGNWLEGSLLITTYFMIAVGFWFEKVVDF